jgi:hypothetical protein
LDYTSFLFCMHKPPLICFRIFENCCFKFHVNAFESRGFTTIQNTMPLE